MFGQSDYPQGHHQHLYGGDTMHLTSLTPNRQHWLYMRSDCGEDSSAWFGVRFTTPCTPLSHAELPLGEDFEERHAGDMTLWECTIPMATYSGTGNTVALKWTASNMFSLDDLTLEVHEGQRG